MSIIYNVHEQTFQLNCKDSSYIIGVFNNQYLVSLYYGKKVEMVHPNRMEVTRELGFSPSPSDCFYQRNISLDTLPQEFPSYGYGDFRVPSVLIEQENGSRITDFKYVGYEILDSKLLIKGIPTIQEDDDVDCLKIILKDEVANIEANLYYNVYASRNIITRHVTIKNNSNKVIKIQKLASCSFDLRDANYELIDLFGSHCNERHIERVPLHHGITKIESRRVSSSHMLNPFFALVRKNADEYNGECIGINLVYSGNFEGTIERDQRETLRVQMGMGSFDFEWPLNSGEEFEAPEVVMAYSSEGLNKMSQEFHNLYNDCLLKKHYHHPIVCNNWEATYFGFDEEKLEALIKSCKGLGIETFVLDDGWFGKRNDDLSSLGDWKVNKNKLPGGLERVSELCKENGLNFGLWFEPEMISEDSDLFRAHPDYAIKVEDRASLYSRCQFVLDLSKDEVCDYVINAISDVVNNINISYIKWDFNRNITETANKQLAHKYVLGFYKVLDAITTKYPNIMIEGCSGGGGRVDPAALSFTPQIWTSDDSDAIERLFIQYGTSMCYPPTTMVGHVSVCPNHQTGRVTPFMTRGIVAMSCNFGYELNPQILSEKEREMVKEQTTIYADLRKVIYDSDFYRLRNPYESNASAWSFVSKDKEHVYVMYVRILNGATNEFDWLTLKGLDKEAIYEDTKTHEIYTGEELENVGILLPRHPYDFHGILYEFKKVKDNG